MVANTGVSVPLELVPRQLRSHETYLNTNLLQNHTVQQLMNESVHNNRGFAVGVLNPVQWDGAVVYVDQT